MRLYVKYKGSKFPRQHLNSPRLVTSSNNSFTHNGEYWFAKLLWGKDFLLKNAINVWRAKLDFTLTFSGRQLSMAIEKPKVSNAYNFC